MSRIIAFTGDNQSPSDWLKLIDRTVAMRNNDRDKLEIFTSKLFVDSPADGWFKSIPVKIRKSWRMVRELFVLKWIEKAEQERIAMKVNLFLQELGHAQPRSAPQDILFVEPLPPSSPAFDLTQLRQLITASDVDNISIFCAKTTGTEHEYFACLWRLAFEAGKKSKTMAPHLHVGIQAAPNREALSTGIQSETPRAISSSTQTSPPTLVDAVTQIPTNRPHPLPHSTATIAIQVDIPPPPLPTPPPVPQPVDSSSPVLPVSCLNWAEDATSLPILPLLPTPTVPRQHPPRDFSGLRSSRLNPFGSLQRRSKQSRPPVSSRFPQTIPFTQTLHSRYRPPPLRPPTKPRIPRQASKNVSSISFPSSRVSALDWDQDPRLLDLSRALKVLGWTRS